jgi:hypothetical protein
VLTSAPRAAAPTSDDARPDPAVLP